jgi:hypothetical protein
MTRELIEEQFQSNKEQLQYEINSGVNIWVDMFQNDFNNELVYAYAKGSALKQWESAIDYVPILSDVDIHLKVKDMFQFQEILTLEKAFSFSEKYKQVFETKQKNKTNIFSQIIHLPRFQIMIMNQLLEDPRIILPRKQDIETLFGEVEFPQNEISADFIKKVDFERIVEEYAFLNSLPSAVFDRSSSNEFWTVLRRMNWRVSPSPVRLLTQIMDSDPLDIWTWNRTTIVNKLKEQGFSEVAENYENYYLTGWKLFNSNFKDLELYKKSFFYGSSVLSNCYHAATRINQEKY